MKSLLMKMKFNPPAFAFAVVAVGVSIFGPRLGLSFPTTIGVSGLALVGLLTVAYYQTRRLD
jgi:hypothetical protein